MKSKATHAFSVIHGDTCHSTFPNWLLFFFVELFLFKESGPPQPKHIILNSLQWHHLVKLSFKFSCTYVCRRTSVQVDGPKVGAVLTRIQRTNRRAPAGCTLVANPCFRATALAVGQR